MNVLEYHELTKHSVASVRASRHVLDWDTQPPPFKVYVGLERVLLPQDFSRHAVRRGVFDLAGLARLLFYTGGITRKRRLASGEEYYFRAAACTGALYHIDLYVVCGDLGDLEAGVYHFGVHDFSLHRLRRGDFRPVVVAATGGEPSAAGAPVILICTSTFWRNAWKYQARTYRHCFWDSGTMLANLLAVAEAAAIPARIVLGFADDAVNELLGLDTRREAALACVAVGEGEPVDASAGVLQALERHSPPPRSPAPFRGEVDYPAIRAAHSASSLATPEEARRWRERAFRRPLAGPQGLLVPLAATAGLAPRSVEQTIARRGSTRRFGRVSIAHAALSHILRTAVTELNADFCAGAGDDRTSTALLSDIYLIVHAVDGLSPGAYLYRRDRDALELLKPGDFRREAGFLDLGQELAADASVNLYALADLGLVVRRLGDRGYRAASLEAAIIGGRVYLSAYALGLGATGLTFFDDDVTAFFSPHAAGKSVLFLTAVGRGRKGESAF